MKKYHEVPRSEHLGYLALIINKDEKIVDDVTHRIQVGWLKWRDAPSILCE